MNLVEEKERLFDDDFNCKTDNVDEVVNFCDELTKESKILCCTKSGKLYEHLPNVYISMVNLQKQKN